MSQNVTHYGDFKAVLLALPVLDPPFVGSLLGASVTKRSIENCNYGVA